MPHARVINLAVAKHCKHLGRISSIQYFRAPGNNEEAIEAMHLAAEAYHADLDCLTEKQFAYVGPPEGSETVSEEEGEEEDEKEVDEVIDPSMSAWESEKFGGPTGEYWQKPRSYVKFLEENSLQESDATYERWLRHPVLGYPVLAATKKLCDYLRHRGAGSPNTLGLAGIQWRAKAGYQFGQLKASIGNTFQNEESSVRKHVVLASRGFYSIFHQLHGLQSWRMDTARQNNVKTRASNSGDAFVLGKSITKDFRAYVYVRSSDKGRKQYSVGSHSCSAQASLAADALMRDLRLLAGSTHEEILKFVREWKRKEAQSRIARGSA